MKPTVAYVLKSAESGYYFTGFARNGQIRVHDDQRYAVRWRDPEPAHDLAKHMIFRVVRLVRKAAPGTTG